jgi:hypothetical protein
MYSGLDIPSATVQIYTGTTYLGQATTYADSGYFTYSLSTTNTYTSFTAKASKPGYTYAEKTVSGTGTSFYIGDLSLDTYHTLIAGNEFLYNPDAYLQYWSFYSEGNHETSCQNGIATVYETSGTRTSGAYVQGYLDLSMWTRLSSIQLEVRFKATSDYYGGNYQVTRATFGLTKPGLNPAIPNNILWSSGGESWLYTTDTGWITRTYTISTGELPLLLNEYQEYDFFWGFEDFWDRNWNQHVYLDYFRVYGDSPPGPLILAKDVYHTEPTLKVFEYGSVDMDQVAVSYSTSINAKNTLGFLDGSVTDPHIESSICVALESDRLSAYDTINGESWKWYNVVDRVNITISITKGTSAAGGPNVIEYVKVNQPLNKGPDAGEVMAGLLGLIAEPIGWIEPWGGVVKLGINALTYSFKDLARFEYNYDSLTFEYGTGYTTAIFDFANLRYAEEAHGTEDFKMSMMAEVPYLQDTGIFSVNVDYEVVLKQVLIDKDVNGITLISETYNPYYFHDHLELIHLNDFTNIHLVQFSSNDADNSHITCTAGSGTTVYNTGYPGNWKIIDGSAVTVTADPDYDRYIGPNPRLFLFNRMETSFWTEGRLRLFPIATSSRTLTYTFNPEAYYYHFHAVYQLSN